MKLCVFQGTFNPIHKAHLMMADYVLENFDVDKILFIPAYKPPHKDCEQQLSHHRLNMVKIATKSNPKFEVSDIEYESESKSYTYITICKLYEKYDIEGKIKFIIGTDAFEKIETWYEADKLKDLIEFIVFVREKNFDKTSFERLKLKGYNFKFAQMDFKDISSTELKQKLSKNKPTGDFITDEIDYYIRENGLYNSK